MHGPADPATEPSGYSPPVTPTATFVARAIAR
jgi:hypothetical protein